MTPARLSAMMGLMCSGLAFAQGAGLADKGAHVRRATVRVAAEFAYECHANEETLIPPTWEEVGTGFIVDSDGDVATSLHTMQPQTAIEHMAEHYKSQAKCLNDALSVHLTGLEINIPDWSLTVKLARENSPAAKPPDIYTIVTDEINDVAVIHWAAAFRQAKKSYTSSVILIPTLSTAPPKKGEAISTSGFPNFSKKLVTTTGAIVLNPYSGQTLDGYSANLTVEGGNSGGPVYTVNGGAIIGVLKGTSMGSRSHLTFAYIVPINRVLELIPKHK